MGNTSTHGKKGQLDERPLSPRGAQVFDFSPGSSSKLLFPVEDDDYPAIEGRPRTTTISQGTSLAPNALPTVFKWEGGGKNVCIAGSFNQWKSKIPLVRSHGDFVTILDLPEGKHEYKFYVDGQWVHNPMQPMVDNELGTKNNVVEVRKSDFEVFEALAMDGAAVDIGEKKGVSGASTKSLSSSPPGNYAQDLPFRSRSEWSNTGPPTLPPHLLQVILNKDVPVYCEPSLLPEPNHVMLNHLYALSIKDGVMVLSATHRFRKKYVTSLLYKPISGT